MADQPPSPPRRLRACAPCTRAKARCRFKEEEAGRQLCERCERLGIECSAKTTKSLRKTRQIKLANGGAALERQGIPRVNNDNAAFPPAAGNQIPDVHNSSVSLLAKSSQDVAHSHRIDQGSITQTGHTNNLPPLGLSWDQATRILAIFRKHYMPVFPFVIVEDAAVPQQLHTERPFLFRAIMLVAAPLSVPRIVKMKRNVLAYLSQQIFVEEKRTLDLLQGLLVCIAWAHTCQISDEQVTNLTHLALGYAHNLGITKILPPTSRKADSNDAPRKTAKTANADTVERTHSLEEQRAFLGCFCVLSVTSFQASRRDPLGGSYVGLSRDALFDMSTSRTDLLLDRIVRMAQMGKKLSQGFGEPHERDQARSYAFLLEGSGRRFRTELDRLTENTAHPDLAEHRPLFELYHQYLIVRLYEPAVTVADRPEEGVPPSMYRSLCLRNCFGAAKEFLDTLLAQPIDAFSHRSILTTDQATFVMFMAARLLLIDAPDWDVTLARRTLDLRTILNQIIARITETEALRTKAVEEFASETGDLSTGEERKVESRLAEAARKTRWLREWFEARLQGRSMQEQLPIGGDGTGATTREAGDGSIEPSWSGGLLGDAAWNFDSPNV